MGKKWKQWQTLFFWTPKSLPTVTAPMKLKDTCSLEESILKSRDITLLTKVHINKAIFFSVVIYGWESWTIMKAERQRIDAFKLWCWRRLLKIPWAARRLKAVNLKGNQSWIFTGRMDDETEAPILWLPYVTSQLIGEDPDAGKDWGQEEKWAVEDEMFGWHHWVNGHEFEQTLGNSEGRGSLACCSPWGHKESNTTEQLNNSEAIWSWTFLYWEVFIY